MKDNREFKKGDKVRVFSEEGIVIDVDKYVFMSMIDFGTRNMWHNNEAIKHLEPEQPAETVYEAICDVTADTAFYNADSEDSTKDLTVNKGDKLILIHAEESAFEMQSIVTEHNYFMHPYLFQFFKPVTR